MIYVLGGISLGLGLWYVWLWGYEQGYMRAKVDFIIMMASFAQQLDLEQQQALAAEWEKFYVKVKKEKK